MFSLNEILLKFKRQIFKTSLNSKFVRGSVIGRSLKEPRPPLEDSRVAAAGWLLGTFSIAISTGDSSFQMATTTAFVLQMDHLGPFAGVEARNTRFGDLSSHLHTHNLCQEKEDHFTLLPGKTLLDLLFYRNHRNLLILKRAFSQPALSFAFIVQF